MRGQGDLVRKGLTPYREKCTSKTLDSVSDGPLEINKVDLKGGERRSRHLTTLFEHCVFVLLAHLRTHPPLHLVAFGSNVFISVIFELICPCFVAAQNLITAVLQSMVEQKFSTPPSLLTLQQHFYPPQSGGIVVSHSPTDD